MPTIRDVAERAKVAPITVSRVINNSGYVSAETRARVEKAIEELQYVPNSLARSLRFKRTHTLALVLTDITNPFWTTVARGVEDAASAQRFNVILCNTDENEAKQDEYLRVLLQKQVDGFILVPARSRPEPIEFLKRQKVAVVVLDRRVPGACVDIVRGDSEGGAYELTRRLIEMGHRRIALLSGPEGVSTAEDREKGYRRALLEAGIEPEAAMVCRGTFTHEGGYRMALEAMKALPKPTALFAANNFIAVGALRALRELGLRVPEDISLVSFDDIPPALAIEPFLTVAAQPAYEMGRRATELLLARLSGELPQEPQEIILPAEVVVRKSCRPL
ncbi:MAG: substrate-binding domain-containing protein [Anaerolineae bacterium]